MDNSGASECKFTCTRNERSQDSIKIFFINGATFGVSNCTLPHEPSEGLCQRVSASLLARTTSAAKTR